MEQKRLELRMAPDPPKSPRLHIPFFQAPPGPLSVPGHPKEKEERGFQRTPIKCIDLQLLKLLKPLLSLGP